MNEEKIARINALAKKAREAELSEEERMERDALRREYLAAIRKNLTAELERTYIVDENGNKRRLSRK